MSATHNQVHTQSSPHTIQSTHHPVHTQSSPHTIQSTHNPVHPRRQPGRRRDNKRIGRKKYTSLQADDNVDIAIRRVCVCRGGGRGCMGVISVISNSQSHQSHQARSACSMTPLPTPLPLSCGLWTLSRDFALRS